MTESSDRPGAAPDESHRDLDRKILRGSAWVGVGYGGKQVLQFASMLALVRLVDPSAFGLMALAWTVLFVIDAIQESGVGSAFVYRRDDIECAAASAAVFATLSGLGLAVGCFLAAPLAAHLFHAPKLTDVLRVLSLMLVIRGASVVPAAILERELDFRRRAGAELLATVVQVPVSVGLAVAGAGVWALVAGPLASSLTATVMYWRLVPWRPSPRLANWKVLRELFGYGRFVTLSNLLVVANNTIDNIIVGRLLGTTQLGFYSVTFRLATLPDDVIGYIVGRVMFPVYSRLQDDRPTFSRVYLENLQRIALLALPVSVALIVAAEPIVLGLLGERWRAVVTPLRILGVYALVRAFAAPSSEVFKGAGRPHLVPVFLVPALLLAIPSLFVLVPRFGLNGAALAMLTTVCVVGVAMFTTTMRLLDVRLRTLTRALRPSFLCAGILAAALAAVLPVASSLPPVAGLALVVAVGTIAYLASTVVFARSVVGPWWSTFRRVETS